VRSLGERIRRLREQRGLSQRDLATERVSYAYISRIEAGSRQPSERALRAIADKLGVTAHDLESGGKGTCPHCGR
jgi:transcriptional regulator with XRE-family HTH domain